MVGVLTKVKHILVIKCSKHVVCIYLDVAGSGSKELTLGAALIDSQGSVRRHSSLSCHPSGIYYPS